MYRSLVLAGLAVIQVVGAVRIDAAETATNYQNVTMDDGTVVPVQLPPGITFVPQPAHSEPTPGLTKRVGWFPGNNAICQPAHDYEMEESTDDDSPWEEDCAKIIDKAQDPRNQGYYMALYGRDYNHKKKGRWARLMSHGTCVFGIEADDDYGVKVGTKDIAETINTALELSYTDRVEWEGKFRCKNSLDDHNKATWAIYHA